MVCNCVCGVCVVVHTWGCGLVYVVVRVSAGCVWCVWEFSEGDNAGAASGNAHLGEVGWCMLGRG